MTNSAVWQLRCNDVQLGVWKAAAVAAGLSANAWCRRALDEAAALEAAQGREEFVVEVPVREVASDGPTFTASYDPKDLRVFRGSVPRKGSTRG